MYRALARLLSGPRTRRAPPPPWLRSSPSLRSLPSHLSPLRPPPNTQLHPAYFAAFFGLVGKKKDEDPETELVSIIKRAVLLIQRDELKGAEQMLHVALKIAQENQNKEGIVYIYDLLANLAFTQGDYPKAEKLFIVVLQRLKGSGAKDTDLKVNHVSLKLAKIYEAKKEFDKAEDGYKFCVKNLQNKVNENIQDEDAITLWAMALDWYGRYLLDQSKLDPALENFTLAYNLCLKVNGEIHEQTVVLLNDLGTISFLKGDNDGAITYLSKAVEIGKHLPNMEDFSSIYVNLGNIYLQQNMLIEAQKLCKEGLQNAHRHKNAEGIREATLCLEEVAKAMAS